MALPQGRVGVLALLVLVPILSGCTWLLPPAPGEGLHRCLTREAWVVPALAQEVRSPFGEVNLTGRALAVPVRCGPADEGAVYLNITTRYRADEVFQERRAELHGDQFVQPPAGLWADVRAGQGWVRATDADVAAFGDLDSALARASRAIPRNNTPPKPAAWTLNGTLVATVGPESLSLAQEAGPYLFTRNATSAIVVTGNLIITYSPLNHTLDAINGSAIAHAQVRDPGVADLAAAWGDGQAEVRVLTRTRFRETDLVVTDAGGGIVAVEFPSVAVVSMLQNELKEVRDDFVRLEGRDVAAVLKPA